MHTHTHTHHIHTRRKKEKMIPILTSISSKHFTISLNRRTFSTLLTVLSSIISGLGGQPCHVVTMYACFLQGQTNSTISKGHKSLPILPDFTHTHTQTHTDTGTHTHKHSDYAKLNLHSLKQAATEMDDDSSMEQKHGRATVFFQSTVYHDHQGMSSRTITRHIACVPSYSL